MLVAGCAAPENDLVPYRIGASFVDIDEPTEMIQRGVLDNANGPGLTARWNSAGNSPEKQRADITEFLAEPVDALILQPADPDVLAFARDAAAQRGVVLVWVREPRVDPDPLPESLPRVEVDWAHAVEELRDLVPAGRPIALVGGRAENAAVVAKTAGPACQPANRCQLGLEPGDSPPVIFALGDEMLLKVSLGSPGTPLYAQASEACAESLLAGAAGGCLDTRPFEHGRAALQIATARLETCGRPGAPDGPFFLSFLAEAKDAEDAEPPPVCAGREAPVEAETVAVTPRWVPPEAVAELTYRWPDLPILSFAGTERVVGDGYH